MVCSTALICTACIVQCHRNPLLQHPFGVKRPDLVAVVAPFCIKGLRLVTMQLPEKFSPSRPGTNRTSPSRSSKKYGTRQRSMPPYRLLSCSRKDHEQKEVLRGRLLLHATHPGRQAGPGQVHLRGGQRAPSAGVRSFPSPPRHTSGEGVVPEFAQRGYGGRLFGGGGSPGGPAGGCFV